MANPDTKHFENSVSDFLIEELLASDHLDDRMQGLIFIEGKKRHELCGVLRSTFKRVQSADIADIWQQAMYELVKAGQEGVINTRWGIGAYVYTILKRRAIDFLRRRNVRKAIDIDWVDVASYDELDQAPAIASECYLLDYMNALSKKKGLSEADTAVILHFTTLLLATNNIPSPAELTYFVNEERVSNDEEELGVAAVKSAKARAIGKLRGEGDGKQGDQEMKNDK